MAGFCEIKLATPLDNSLLGESLPTRRVFGSSIDIRITPFYTNRMLDNERFVKSYKSSLLLNDNSKFLPNYYPQEITISSLEEQNSLQKQRNTIKPFSEFKGEDNKKLKNFNNLENTTGRISATIKKSLGTQTSSNKAFLDETLYTESSAFKDNPENNLSIQILNDPFYFLSKFSTKYNTEIEYPYSSTNYYVNKLGMNLGASIQPFNILDEIQFNFTTIGNLQGIKGGDIKITITPEEVVEEDLEEVLPPVVSGASVKASKLISTRKVYDDEGIPDILATSSRKKVNRFKSVLNEEGNLVLSVDATKSFTYAVASNQNIYLNVDKDVIKPLKEAANINAKRSFDYTDRVKIDEEMLVKVTQNDYSFKKLSKNKRKFRTSIKDFDASVSNGLDSIAFAGLMD